MQVGMPLLIHGEVTDQDIDLFDREAVFIEQYLRPLSLKFTKLKIVMEHITTKEAVEFVSSSADNVAATITAHHLLYNRNAIFKGGVNPHMYCLPVLKREQHRVALLQAVLDGNKSSHKFFAGTDSAPHAKSDKESSCGCAGCYTAFGAVELYTEAFMQGYLTLQKLTNKDDQSKENTNSSSVVDSSSHINHIELLLRKFLCENGAIFYNLNKNSDDLPSCSVKLARKSWKVPDSYAFNSQVVVPLRAGQDIEWSIV
jgi:dihydroorotase